MPDPPHEAPDAWHFHRARTRRVVDGDTYDLEVDLGFRCRKGIRVRLHGVDTAEIFGVSHESDEYRRGQKHAEFVTGWFAAAARGAPDHEWPLEVWTLPTSGKYGRWIASIRRHSDGELLGDALREKFKTVADE